jgi:hypothetical protein
MFHRSPRRRDKKKMGIVVRFPRGVMRGPRHFDHPQEVVGRDLSPPSNCGNLLGDLSRDGHPVPSQSAVIQPPVTPMDCANSPRLMDLDSRVFGQLHDRNV